MWSPTIWTRRGSSSSSRSSATEPTGVSPAREAVTGLAVNGPVRLVNATKASLRQQIRAAELFAQTSTGAQTSLHGTQTAAARRSLAKIEHLPIDQASRLIKAAEPRRQHAARLPDVTRFGRDTSGRSGPEYGLSL